RRLVPQLGASGLPARPRRRRAARARRGLRHALRRRGHRHAARLRRQRDRDRPRGPARIGTLGRATMVHARDGQPPTRPEVIVLARLSVSKPPGPKDLAETVHRLALPSESPGRAREVALETLNALRGRGLVSWSAKARKGNLGDRSLTDDGQRMLRAVFGL